VIDEENNQVGIIDRDEALNLARQAGLDLVEVAPNSDPPVCRIMDYGKWMYQQKRKEKLSQKKQHQTVLKELRLRPKIEEHDMMIKVNHARKFLEKGNKVQFTMMFRGREMTHVDIGYEMMEQILEELGDVSKIDRPAKMLGKRMTMVLSPVSNNG
jgi:translation initiation factor IF-3